MVKSKEELRLETKIRLAMFNHRVETYGELPELVKITFRVARAKILAIEESNKGTGLLLCLNLCVESENYCGAEGIKQAIESQNKPKEG